MKKMMITAAAAVMAISMGITAHAEEMLDRDYVEAEIWEEMWLGKGDDGTEFPEASYKHHLLDQWLDAEYGSEDHDWSSIGELKRDYKSYYRQLIEDWDFEDADGKWTITTEDNSYSFTMLNGTWQMLDSTGNTVDSFPPFSTLEEETGTAEGNDIPDDNNGHPSVKDNLTGRTETASKTAAASAESVSEADTESPSERDPVASKAMPLIVLGIGGAAAVAFVVLNKKK